MIKSIPGIEGNDFYKADVETFRTAVIELRDAALTASMFDWAVTLSHLVALLSGLLTLMEE